MNPILIDAAVQILNEAYAADPEAMKKLFTPVKVSDALAEHPSIIVGKDNDMTPLGLFNGIMEMATGYRISAEWENDELKGGFAKWPIPNKPA